MSSLELTLFYACRDYTNPYLPVAPAHADPNMLALGIQAPLSTSGNPMEGNVLLCQVWSNAWTGSDCLFHDQL